MNDSKENDDSDDGLVHFNQKKLEEQVNVNIHEEEDEKSQHNSIHKTRNLKKSLKHIIEKEEEIDYENEDPDINFLLEPIKREESIKEARSCQSLPRLSIGHKFSSFRFPINSPEMESYFSQMTPSYDDLKYTRTVTEGGREDRSLIYGMEQSNISIASNAELIRV